jgi:hypothetical protein
MDPNASHHRRNQCIESPIDWNLLCLPAGNEQAQWPAERNDPAGKGSIKSQPSDMHHTIPSGSPVCDVRVFYRAVRFRENAEYILTLYQPQDIDDKEDQQVSDPVLIHG